MNLCYLYVIRLFPLYLNLVSYYIDIVKQKCCLVQKYIELCSLLCLNGGLFDSGLYFVEESRYMEKVLQKCYKVLKASK